MNAHGDRRAGWPALAGISSRLVAAVLASTLATGCDHPFEPFQESEDAVFSIFGYLDLKADTQWVRVMPVRQDLFLDPEPIDAVVTLEHLGSGRTVTLNDSLFGFVDRRLDAVAYVHNFWTTERLQPGASYRLTAARSDGASTTALVVMPPELEISLLEDSEGRRNGSVFGLLQVQAEHVLFVEMLHDMSTPTGGRAVSIATRDTWTFSTDVPGTHGIGIRADSLRHPDFEDVRRMEVRVAAGLPDWPYHAGLSDLTIRLPSTMPSNVENGVGFVGGVATWTVPFDGCDVLSARPDREDPCTTSFDAQSASVAGRVIREPCGDPHVLAHILLTAEFAGGGAVVRSWKTGWDGGYRFEGIEPNSDLVLEVPGTPAVHLPRVAMGEHYTVGDISVSGGC